MGIVAMKLPALEQAQEPHSQPRELSLLAFDESVEEQLLDLVQQPDVEQQHLAN